MHQEFCLEPNEICDTCRLGLTNRKKNTVHLSFGRPFIWTDSVNHERNFYTCSTQIVGFRNSTSGA